LRTNFRTTRAHIHTHTHTHTHPLCMHEMEHEENALFLFFFFITLHIYIKSLRKMSNYSWALLIFYTLFTAIATLFIKIVHFETHVQFLTVCFVQPSFLLYKNRATEQDKMVKRKKREKKEKKKRKNSNRNVRKERINAFPQWSFVRAFEWAPVVISRIVRIYFVHTLLTMLYNSFSFFFSPSIALIDI